MEREIASQIVMEVFAFFPSLKGPEELGRRRQNLRVGRRRQNLDVQNLDVEKLWQRARRSIVAVMRPAVIARCRIVQT